MKHLPVWLFTLVLVFAAGVCLGKVFPDLKVQVITDPTAFIRDTNDFIGGNHLQFLSDNITPSTSIGVDWEIKGDKVHIGDNHGNFVTIYVAPNMRVDLIKSAYLYGDVVLRDRLGYVMCEIDAPKNDPCKDIVNHTKLLVVP